MLPPKKRDVFTEQPQERRQINVGKADEYTAAALKLN
jgi:hypothetical protein